MIRIEVSPPTFLGQYVHAQFMIHHTTIDSGPLDEKDCIIMAERLRQGADAFEFYSRAIADNKDKSETAPN